MTTDGRSVLADAAHKDTRTVRLGDVQTNPDTQAPTAPPTLRAPGEKLPIDDPNNSPVSTEGPMKPVIFPKDTTNDPAHTTQAHPDRTAPADGTKPAAEEPVNMNAPDPEDVGPDGKPKTDPKPDSKPAAPAPSPNTNFYPTRM
jgi:hypothetical protein